MSSQQTFVILGALLEFTGVVLLASPDAHPYAIRLGAWLQRHTRQAANRIRRILRRPPLRKTVSIGAAAEGGGSMRLSGIASVNPEATAADKVDFLLRRDQETQSHLNTLATQIEDIEHGTPRQLEELRGQVETHVEHRVTAALEAHRPQRLLGSIALALGVVCVSTATFL